MKVGSGRTFAGVSRLIQDKKLHTVCRSAGCPNRPECWSSGTATFMILGIMVFIAIIVVEAFLLVRTGKLGPQEKPAFAGPSLMK